jgi:ubiquinone/menaquinone biosynthesis C-methylase UbiE
LKAIVSSAQVPRLELTRTLELLNRFLPSAPARLIDVGGGPGAYSAVWAREGYDVHLYDVLELHVQQARLAADAQAEHPFTAQVADARSIPEPDGSADAVVPLGPLYHLTERAQRASALLEALRILKPSGVVAAVGISRFAALVDALWQGWLSDPLFRTIAERDLVDAQHRNPDPVRYPQWFTTAYFHRPEELAAEVQQAGFYAVSLHGVEGPGWLMQEHWPDPRSARTDVLRGTGPRIGANAERRERSPARRWHQTVGVRVSRSLRADQWAPPWRSWSERT